MRQEVIVISGGIGSGKSVVSRILTQMGFPVYDCDSQAKLLMDKNEKIKNEIRSKIDPNVIANGIIDRKRLGQIVFNDSEALKTLNEIVHEAVRNDIKSWIKHTTSTKLFIETAILYQSGIDRMVDAVWEIYAPTETRISRVIKRNGFSREEVISRINSQNITIYEKHHKTSVITNDDILPVLPQINFLLKSN